METSSPENSLSDVFSYHPRLANVRNYVSRNLSENITLHDAAQIACLEKKYFSTFFHKKTGICFSHWLARIRIESARKIIKTEHTSITEIAFNVGFRDLRSFQRAFKRHTGVTPREFKRSITSHIDTP
ncbi:MAG: AraC family transcriptional regulator [Pseudomonadales bacterium]|nr:AraC family transcriptional regulator [Pseudomonadales bacterium]